LNSEQLIVGAELVGAIAVLITLVYLAIQTRDNTRVMKSRAVWDAQVSFVEVNETLGDGGVVSKLVYKALSDPGALSSYEKYLAHRFCRSWLQRMEAQFALYQAGILDEEVWELRRSYAKAVLENPVMKEGWESDKNNSMFTRAFISSIDSTVAVTEPTFLGIEK
jgi:hypothetical protein